MLNSAVHCAFVDGGYATSPVNAVFDPVHNKWIAENEGVAPDIEVRQDAKALEAGRDPQLERAVKELLKQVEEENQKQIVPPPYSTPAIKK